MQIEKMIKKKKFASEKKMAITEQDSSSTTSSVSLYNIDFENDNYDYASSQIPSLIKEDSSSHEQGEEINSSQATIKIPS